MVISNNSAICIGIFLIILLILINILNKKNKIKKVVFNIILIFILVSLTEIFIFNITSFRLYNGKYQTQFFDISHIKLKGIQYDSKKNKFKVNSNSQASIELLDINKEVGTISIKLSDMDIYNVKIQYADETLKSYNYSLPNKTMINKYNRSKYISCFFSGNVSKLKIDLVSVPVGTEFGIENISVNENIPININFYRYFIILVFCICCYLLLKLNIFSKPYNNKNLIQNIIFVGIIIMFSVLNLLLTKTSKGIEDLINNVYSYKLVDSLSSGKTYLDIEVSEKLKKLENPYDISQRVGVSYVWDSSYYNGKYYVYFGVVPAILIFVPFKIIFGKYASYVIVGKIFIVVFSVFLSLLIKRIFMKYFKNVEYRILIICCIILQFGSIVTWLSASLVLYEFIMLTGITFSVIGLYFYFLAIKENNRISYPKLLICCLCLALAVGCRPTTLLVSFVIIPKLLSIFIKKCKEKNRVDIIKMVLVIGLPYMIVGIGLMIYNFVRFGNVMEFGSNYQLTVNDIGTLGVRLSAGIIGAFQCLFNFPVISWEFPFIAKSKSNLIYYGYLYNEGLVAGIMYLSPITLFAFTLPLLKKYIKFNTKKDLEIYRFSVLLIVVSIALTIISVTMGAVVQRYVVDFSYLLNIAAIIIFLLLYCNLQNKKLKDFILKLLFICMIYTIIMNIIPEIFLRGNTTTLTDVDCSYLRNIIAFWE